MRLAIVSTFPPFRGGIAQFNEAMATALEGQGHEVVRITWSRQYPDTLFPGKASGSLVKVHQTWAARRCWTQ